MPESEPGLIHQALYGYDRGHGLLAASEMPKWNDKPSYFSWAETWSDLSGYIPYDDSRKCYYQWDRYYTGLYITSELYAVMLTVNDRTCSRAGCVKTHAVFVPAKHVRSYSLQDLIGILMDPRERPLSDFRVQLQLENHSYPVLESETNEEHQFIERLSGSLPILWEHDALGSLRMMQLAWTRFPRKWAPSFCTMSLQNRRRADFSLELQFFPSCARGRFHGQPVAWMYGEMNRSNTICTGGCGQ